MFRDRSSAGLALAAELKKRHYRDPVVLAIPKGGLVVGREIARELEAPMDMYPVHNIGHPRNPDITIGAVGIKDVLLVPFEGVPADYIRLQIGLIRKKLVSLEILLKQGKPYLPLKDKTVILTADGISSGNTLLAAVNWIKQEQPAQIIVAVPVAAAAAAEQLHLHATACVFLLVPQFFSGIRSYYEAYFEVSDAEALRAFTP